MGTLQERVGGRIIPPDCRDGDATDFSRLGACDMVDIIGKRTEAKAQDCDVSEVHVFKSC